MKIGNKSIQGIFVYNDTGGNVIWEVDDLLIYEGGIYQCLRETTSKPDTSNLDWRPTISSQCTVEEFRQADPNPFKDPNIPTAITNKFVSARVAREAIFGNGGLFDYLSIRGEVKTIDDNRDLNDLGNKTLMYFIEDNSKVMNTPHPINGADFGLYKQYVPSDSSIPATAEYISLGSSVTNPTGQPSVRGISYRTGTVTGSGITWQGWQSFTTSEGVSNTQAELQRMFEYMKAIKNYGTHKWMHRTYNVNPSRSFTLDSIGNQEILKILVSYKKMIRGVETTVRKYIDLNYSKDDGAVNSYHMNIDSYDENTLWGIEILDNDARLTMNGVEYTEDPGKIVIEKIIVKSIL